MNVAVRRRMTVAEFLEWAMAQPSGRYELVDGQVVAMSPERSRHNLVKARIWRELTDLVASVGLPCTVFTDGMTVVIDDHHSREPDIAIQCGVEADPDSVVLEAPLIVVEVVSPFSERDDTGAKLVEYFSVPSIRHYLIVNPEKRVVVHHERSGSAISTKIVSQSEDTVTLDPPGLTVPVSALMGDS